MHPAVHPLVHDVVDVYLSTVDAEVPGLVQGLYLTGSVALDDFHPEFSDVDFVAVSTSSPAPDQISALERVHTSLARRRPRPFFDGPYVTWDELADDPMRAARGPHAHEGRLSRAARADRHPVTWHTLAHHGVTLRGPEAGDVNVATDPGGLTAWTHRNLEIYWRPWWQRGSRLWSRSGVACLGAWAPQWGVLGVSRLHYTLNTGKITSKYGAGEYARQRFGSEWHRIVDGCLRIRSGANSRSFYRNPFTRRSHALAFMDMAIQDAQLAGDSRKITE